MPDPYYLLREQDKLLEREAELRAELDWLENEWWKLEDLITCHGEKQP